MNPLDLELVPYNGDADVTRPINIAITINRCTDYRYGMVINDR